MTNIKKKCEEYFGTSNLYEVLNIEPGASLKEIKKAYHKLSLIVHPDRVDESQKIVATEKFKVLGKIHTVLQDKEKRKLYDDFGELDEDSDCDFNWIDYWRKLFKVINLEDIKSHEQEYLGSETELRDIKKAYVAAKGNMNKIQELVPFSNCDSEPRIIEIVRKMVDDGEVEEYDIFFNEPERMKKQRHRKFAKEKKEAEKVNYEELEKDIQKGMEKRMNKFIDFIKDIEEKHTKGKKRQSITSGKGESPNKRVTRTKK